MNNPIVKATNRHGLKVTSIVKAAWLACAVAFAALSTVVWKATGQTVPAPVLKATLVSTNVQVTVTNGVSTAAYELHWRSELNSSPGLWNQLIVGTTGQTNFLLNVSHSTQGFLQAKVRNDSDRDRILFGDFVAQDQSFTGLIPFDWQVQVASLRHFLLTSGHDEKVSVDAWDVPMDAQSLAVVSQLFPLSNAMQIYSPPLAPVDVLKQLYPRFAQGTVQNLSVLRSNTFPMPGGVQAGVFDYRYLYQGQRPYEGEVLIITLPPTYTPFVNYWSLISLGGEGPAEFFQKNKALYVCVLNSLKYNQSVLNQAAREPFDRMWENDPEYNKRMDDLITSLGRSDGHTYEESNGARHNIWGPLPGPGERIWWCGGNTYRIGALDFGCVPLERVVH